MAIPSFIKVVAGQNKNTVTAVTTASTVRKLMKEKAFFIRIHFIIAPKTLLVNSLDQMGPLAYTIFAFVTFLYFLYV